MAHEAVGIDIGGTGVKIGRVNARGEVLTRTQIPAPVEAGGEEAVEAIAAAAAPLLAAAVMPALGVGCAGLVDSGEGLVHTSPNLPRWHEVPLGALLTRHLGVPAAVTNDANAFALAEARCGGGRGHDPVVALTLGTGVGGAIVIGGRVFGGRHGFAGEIGHMTVQLDGAPCPCGNRGCLELLVGKRGIVATYLERCRWQPGQATHDLAGGDRGRVEPRLIAAAAGAGETAARDTFARIGAFLGAGLANVCNLFDPSVIVIGGGVAQAGELILGPARRAMVERAMAPEAKLPAVVSAALGFDAGLIGAAFFGMDAARRRGGS